MNSRYPRENEPEASRKAARRIAYCAEKALLYEVSVTPKPGLVDRADSGCHRDMDYHTFLDSIASLPPYFEICAAEGAACAAGEVDGTGGGPALLLTKLRGPGLAAEKEMLRATGGVNTHKGAIFILGILAAAAGYCLAQKSGETDSRFTDGILTVAGRIAAPSLQDLEGPMQAGTEGQGVLGERSEPETEGLRQYRTDGCTGVRGEAAQGFPSLRSCALPVLRGALAEGQTWNDAGVSAILSLILTVDDTTLLKRCKGRDGLETERAYLRTLLAGYPPKEAAALLNERWSKAGISAGGCADLLGAAFFLLFLEQE